MFKDILEETIACLLVLKMKKPTIINIILFIKACVNKWKIGRPHIKELKVISIIPNWLKVENATIFFKSKEIKANIEPIIIVIDPKIII